MSERRKTPASAVPRELVERRIYLIREQRVMLDEDLAELYGVAVKRLNEQVTRNVMRFPADFMFRLSRDEAQSLRSQNATLKGRGQHRKYRARAFTEHGILMLSSVLRSERAVQVNIVIMRTFVRLRQMLVNHTELARKLADMETNYDAQFKVVFEAIRELMKPSSKPKSGIGFGSGKE